MSAIEPGQEYASGSPTGGGRPVRATVLAVDVEYQGYGARFSTRTVTKKGGVLVEPAPGEHIRYSLPQEVSGTQHDGQHIVKPQNVLRLWSEQEAIHAAGERARAASEAYARATKARQNAIAQRLATHGVTPEWVVGGLRLCEADAVRVADLLDAAAEPQAGAE